MLNLVENWRYVGVLTKLIFFLMNLIGTVVALFIVIGYNQPIDSEFTRLDLFGKLLEMQLLFNIPLLIVLNISGLLRKSIYKRKDDE